MQIKSPQFPDQLTAAIVPNGILEEETRFENKLVENVDFSHQKSKNIKIDASKLVRTVFIGTVLEKLSIMDVWMQQMDLSSADFSEASIHRLVLENSRLTGFKMNGAFAKDLHIKEAKANLSQIRFATLKDCLFEECDFTGADFQNTTLSNVSFHKCTLEDVEFSGLKAKNVDLRTSKLKNIKGLTDLKGATIDSSQLFSLSYDLAVQTGFIVSDDE